MRFNYEEYSIDLGSALPYFEEKVKQLLGRDAGSVESKERFKKLFRLGIELASHVQCIGMSKPIPIHEIYQPTRLAASPFDAAKGNEKSQTTVWNLVDKKTSAVILAGPGGGKTVFMHWLFIQLIIEFCISNGNNYLVHGSLDA